MQPNFWPEHWSLKVKRALYMVAEVAQQENGNRAYSTTGLNKRGQRTVEKEGAWRLRVRASYMVAEVGHEENGDRADSTTGLNKRGQKKMEKEGA
jgi:hypothetical protein